MEKNLMLLFSKSIFKGKVLTFDEQTAYNLAVKFVEDGDADIYTMYDLMRDLSFSKIRTGDWWFVPVLVDNEVAVMWAK